MIHVARSTAASRRHAGVFLAAPIGAGAVPSLRAIPAIHAAGLIVIGASAAIFLSRAARAPSRNDGPPDGFGACVPLVIVAVLLGAACWSGLFLPPGGDMTPVFAATGVLCVFVALIAIKHRPGVRYGVMGDGDRPVLAEASTFGAHGPAVAELRGSDGRQGDSGDGGGGDGGGCGNGGCGGGGGD